MALSNVAFLAGGETGNTNEWPTVGGTVAIEETVVYTGSYSIRVSSASSNYIESGSVFSAAEVRVRLRFYISTSASGVQTIGGFRDSADVSVGYAYIDGSGNDYDLLITGFNSSNATVATDLSDGQWYRLELRYKQGSGVDAEIGAKLDGATEVTVTDGQSTSVADYLRFQGGAADSGAYIYIDDVLGVDAATWPGNGQIEALRPDGDSADSGEDEWEDEGGAAQTYDSVNQDPLTEAQYAIESSQVDADHRQLWGLTSIASVGTINHVRIGIQANRGNGSGTEHRIRSKVSTPENSADLLLDGTSRYYTFDPTTQPSNQSELDSYQAGVWRDSGGREFNCYEQWVMVDYTPSAGGPANVKTVDGLALASIKTVNGLAIASVKSIDGLT
jgi:hypothetical protein